jgi:outer membrane receptor for ferrienterochelin and colicin
MTSGISAEYGRFSGGVINAITKSGGNKFEGTLRADLSKPEWRDETPFEKERDVKREGDLTKIYSATLGGRIVADKLWFFVDGRSRKEQQPNSLPVTGVNVIDDITSERYEGKLTWAMTPGQSLQAAYINNDFKDSNNLQINPLEPDAITGSHLPNDGKVISYTGTLGNSLFSELRYSQKHFAFQRQHRSL